MAILLEEPVVINTETKVFDGVWITAFVATFPSVSDGYIRIETKPFSTTTGEIHQTEPVVISSDKLWKIIQEVPEAAVAMGHILNAIPKIEEWVKKDSTPITDRPNDPEPVVEPLKVKVSDTTPQEDPEAIKRVFDVLNSTEEDEFVFPKKKSLWERFKAFWLQEVF